MSRRRRVRIVAASLLALSMLTLTACEDSFADDCKARGGKIDESTETGTGTGVSAKGQPVVVVTTSTTRYCIVDGSIVAVD